MCAFCTGSSAVTKPTMCINAHKVKMQVLLDHIEQLQRELRTVRTQYSFCKFALDSQRRKNAELQSA